MIEYNFYSHIDHENLDPTERAEKLGIKAWVDKGSYKSGISENIGMVPWHSDVIGCGDTTKNEKNAECHVKSWMESKDIEKIF